MERHHLAQAMCILNTEGCDILESLPRRDYDRAIMQLRDYILASDLATYFKLVAQAYPISQTGPVYGKVNKFRKGFVRGTDLASVCCFTTQIVAHMLSCPASPDTCKREELMCPTENAIHHQTTN